MILEVGQYGITKMKNTHTSEPNKAIMIYKDMPITGIILLGDKSVINLGYNEQIILMIPYCPTSKIILSPFFNYYIIS